jgi:transposase
MVCTKPIVHIMSDKVTSARRTRRDHSDEFKRELVGRCLQPGASVSAIALEAGINANLLFAWRRQHRRAMATRPDGEPDTLLLPVTVRSLETPSSPLAAVPTRAANGTIEIELAGARVRVRGHVDEAALRCVLQALRALA